MSTIHHVAITASDFDESLAFYKKLGFVSYFNKYFPEKGKKLALVNLGDLKLVILKDLTLICYVRRNHQKQQFSIFL